MMTVASAARSQYSRRRQETKQSISSRGEYGVLFLENEIQREIREKFFVKIKTKTHDRNSRNIAEVPCCQWSMHNEGKKKERKRRKT